MRSTRRARASADPRSDGPATTRSGSTATSPDWTRVGNGHPRARRRPKAGPIPQIIFERRPTVHVGDRPVELVHVGGHCADQTMVYLPRQRILLRERQHVQRNAAFIGDGDLSPGSRHCGGPLTSNRIWWCRGMERHGGPELIKPRSRNSRSCSSDRCEVSHERPDGRPHGTDHGRGIRDGRDRRGTVRAEGARASLSQMSRKQAKPSRNASETRAAMQLSCAWT